jgi:hypothetical protein
MHPPLGRSGCCVGEWSFGDSRVMLAVDGLWWGLAHFNVDMGGFFAQARALVG